MTTATTRRTTRLTQLSLLVALLDVYKRQECAEDARKLVDFTKYAPMGLSLIHISMTRRK